MQAASWWVLGGTTSKRFGCLFSKERQEFRELESIHKNQMKILELQINQQIRYYQRQICQPEK